MPHHLSGLVVICSAPWAFSKGGWDAFSKTPTASNAVIYFRVELHLEPEPTRHRCADSQRAKGLPSPCRGRCS